MPATIHLRPDLWQAFSLFSWPLLARLPILMFKGFQALAPSEAGAVMDSSLRRTR